MFVLVELFPEENDPNKPLDDDLADELPAVDELLLDPPHHEFEELLFDELLLDPPHNDFEELLFDEPKKLFPLENERPSENDLPFAKASDDDVKRIRVIINIDNIRLANLSPPYCFDLL